MHLALLLSALLSPASAADVEMSGLWLRALMEPDDPKPEKGPRPWISARDVVLTEAEDAVRMRVEWRIQAVEPGWIDVPVVDASVRLDKATLGGSGVALKSLRDGRRHLVAWIDGPTTLVIEGEVVAELRRGVTLALLPAPVGRVRVETADPVVDVRSGGVEVVELQNRFWTGAPSIQVSSTAEKPVAKTGQLAVGAVGMGVTVGDGALDVRARLRWRVVRGELGRVSFTVPGAGPDLEVTGPVVAKWTRGGDTINVELLEPQSAFVELEARWSTAVPNKDEVKVPFPTATPQGVFRTERSVQIARDGDREIIPAFGSWEPIPADALPEVARDLVVGTPSSAWKVTDDSRPQLGLLRFKPVSGPPTIVDVAAYDGALSRDGRLLMRAHYTVRNDRGAFLRVKAPPGSRIVGARVGGEPASVARDGDTWLVPLLKSVETVQGLLNFPVDLLILSDGTAFEKKEERAIPLPVLDAEVAVTRVTLSLPVGWENKLDEGEAESVPDFTEGSGITYGFSTGDENVAKADALFQDAVSAWMSNDFDAAQESLDDLRNLGASNENIARLQSNIDLVFEDAPADAGGGGQAVALQRRVKEQAQARASKDLEVQEKLIEEAEQAYLSGDYGKAEEAYNQALDIGQNLERIQQSESVEQTYSNRRVEAKLEKAKNEKKKRKKADVSGGVSGFISIDLAEETEVDELNFDGATFGGEAAAVAGVLGAKEGKLGGKGAVDLDRLVAEEREKVARESARKAAEEEARRREEDLRRQSAEEAERKRAEAERAAAEASRAAEESRRLPTPDPIDAEELDTIQFARDKPANAPVVQRRSRRGPRINIGMAKKAPPPTASEPPPPPPPPPAATPPVVVTQQKITITEPSTGAVLGKDALQNVPAGRSFESTIEVADPNMAGSTRSTTVYDFEDMDIDGDLVRPEGAILVEPEGFAPLDVTASTLDVVIPTYGETVRYQHLLLPAGQAHAVVVRARKNKKRGTR